MIPGRNSLEAIMRRCGVMLDRGQYDQLWQYHQLLRRANAELNLTRIHQFENMVLKHYVDSLLVLKYADLPSPLIDMGSGPGLPGIPLKIARPEISMILAEPRGARAEFLEQACRTLGLTDVEVYAGKVNSKFPRQVQGVITRAVASIPETLVRVAACLAPGGRMLFMKGPDCDDEIAEAEVGHSNTFQLVTNQDYTIPGTPHKRRLVVYERTATEAPVVGDSVERESHGGLIREVTSDANPTFKLAREVLTGKGIRRRNHAIFSGERIVREILNDRRNLVEAWITMDDDPTEAPELGPEVTRLRLSKALFAELDVAGTRSPLLLVRVPEMVDWHASEPWPLGCTLFVPFQDPENVGAVIRSAAAFGVPRVVLLQEAAHPFHPKSVRAAGPALFEVELRKGPSIRNLWSNEVPLIPLDRKGVDIGSEPFPERFGLVPGVEGPGLPDHLRQLPARRIPIFESVESLNAATAAAIALFAWRSRLGE